MNRIICSTLVIVWMIIVFLFSNQPAVESSKESGTFTKSVLSLSKKYKTLEKEEQEKVYGKIEKVIRKLAHFTLYAIGGVLIFLFMNTFQIPLSKKIMFTILIGFLYASSDEFHQFFIEGRSCQFTDVLIDTLGVIAGAGVIGWILYFI